MFNRRDFLTRTLGGTSLLAVGSAVPEFLARSASAADKDPKAKKDTILVVVEMTGGNDGLNTVAPYGDDLYKKARPTLGFTKRDVLKLDDYHGLHPRLNEFKRLYDEKRLAVIQGVGYPNPDRSHFESMDIWQLADPRRVQTQGWLARSIPGMSVAEAGVPGMFLGEDRLPLALQGADGGVVSLADRNSFKLQLSSNAPARKSLIQELNDDKSAADLAAFVQKRQLQTYTSLQKIEDALKEAKSGEQPSQRFVGGRIVNSDPDSLTSLSGKLGLIGRLIKKGLGTRIYYVAINGFDTHSGQADQHAELLGEISGAVGNFFNGLPKDDADRVVLMTYSEFGRRVKENGSRGTDHGAASCMFLAGPKVKGGIVGAHPKLDDLTDGDLRYHTDFRRVYATLLDGWLGVESRVVLGDQFAPLPLVDKDKKTDLPGTKAAVPAPAGPPVLSAPPAAVKTTVEKE
jgi:uncharacterized protein (DUF1501 family)